MITRSAIAWCFIDEQTPALDRVVEEGGFAPALWPIEAINVLQTAERRRRITSDEKSTLITWLSSLPITIDNCRAGDFSTIGYLADVYALTSYDAVYLDVAIRLSLPLATRDKALITAAKAAGVHLLNTD